MQSLEKDRTVIGLNLEIPPDVDELIQEEVVYRGGRFGTKRLVVIEAIVKGLQVIRNERLISKAS
jgi:hypothetical protein